MLRLKTTHKIMPPFVSVWLDLWSKMGPNEVIVRLRRFTPLMTLQLCVCWLILSFLSVDNQGGKKATNNEKNSLKSWL